MRGPSRVRVAFSGGALAALVLAGCGCPVELGPAPDSCDPAIGCRPGYQCDLVSRRCVGTMDAQDVDATDAGEECGSAGGATLTLCGGVCVDTMTDPSNCGSCGLICRSSARCLNGVCS